MFTIETRGESVILTTDQAGPVTMTAEQALAFVDQLQNATYKAQQVAARRRVAEHHNKELTRLRERHPDAVEVTGKDGLTYLATWGRDKSGYTVIKWPAGQPAGVNPPLPARWLTPYNKRTAHLFDDGYKAVCGEEATHWAHPKPTAKRCPKCAQGEP